MKKNWSQLYQNSVLDTHTLKINSLYVCKQFFGAQFTINEITDSDVILTSRFGTKIKRNIKWCLKNLREIMIMENL